MAFSRPDLYNLWHSLQPHRWGLEISQNYCCGPPRLPQTPCRAPAGGPLHLPRDLRMGAAEGGSVTPSAPRLPPGLLPRCRGCVPACLSLLRPLQGLLSVGVFPPGWQVSRGPRGGLPAGVGRAPSPPPDRRSGLPAALGVPARQAGQDNYKLLANYRNQLSWRTW